MPTSAGWALLVLLLTTTMASAGAKRRRVPPAQSRSQGDAGHGGWWRNNSIPDAQPCHVEVAADDLTPAGFRCDPLAGLKHSLRSHVLSATCDVLAVSCTIYGGLSWSAGPPGCGDPHTRRQLNGS